jgi:hypothetical protein
MPGPLDDTLKQLTELAAPDWVVRGGWPAAATSLIDADIATISGAADKVIRVAGPPDWLLAVDFQAGHDVLAKLPDLLLYNSALFKRHGLLVRTLLVVLHRGADSPQLTGLYDRGFPGEPFDVALRYRMLRVWQVPPQVWLSGGVGLVPLAPLGDVQAQHLPAVIGQMKQRFDQEPPHRAAELWSAAFILMGVRYDQLLTESLLKGVTAMKESVTYQAILKEGEAKGEARGEAKGEAREARKILMMQGRKCFGEPSPEILAALDAMTDVGQLEELGLRLLETSSWQELLGLTP